MKQEIFGSRPDPELSVDVGRKGRKRTILNPPQNSGKMISRWIDVVRWRKDRQE